MSSAPVVKLSRPNVSRAPAAEGEVVVNEVLAGLRPPASGEFRIDSQVISKADPQQRVDLGIYYVPAERKKRGAVMSLPASIASTIV